MFSNARPEPMTTLNSGLWAMLMGMPVSPPVEPGQQGPTTGDHDALLHDVGGELGWGAVERGLHCVDDCGDRLGEGFTHLLGGHRNGARQTADEVAPANVGGELLVERPRRTHVDLDLFGGAVADGE